MHAQPSPNAEVGLSYSAVRAIVLGELQITLSAMPENQVNAAIQRISGASRIFFTGAGRSGLALRMAAMRMMHLGLTAYVAGEVVTPAIDRGDLLVVASGSGSTAGPVRAAQVAKDVGADVLAITTAPTSPLADLADAVLIIPAAEKHGESHTASVQYAGALFEQTVVLLMDIVFHILWQQRGEAAEQLWKRHTNLE